MGKAEISGRARPRERALRAAVVAQLAGASLALTACGDGQAAAGSPIPDDCLEAWNAETPSLTFGKHVYSSHQSKQAQIRLVEPSAGAINITGDEACAVVFAVDQADPEYGDVGLVITKFGWASLKELARGQSARLAQIQREANAAANVNLFPDGTLDPK